MDDRNPAPTEISESAPIRDGYALAITVQRLFIGLLGLGLPVSMWVFEGFVRDAEVGARGSLSAYYHSGARDIFVASLFAIGVVLGTYAVAERGTWKLWVSWLAGIGAIGVAWLPTGRPGATHPCKDADLFDELECTPLQLRGDEDFIEVLHYGFAVALIVSLAALCFAFGKQANLVDEAKEKWVRRFYRACGVGTLAGGVLALVGVLPPTDDVALAGFKLLYIGECAALVAFSCAWLFSARELRSALTGQGLSRWGQLGSSDWSLASGGELDASGSAPEPPKFY